jgi:hypothetical protein
MDERPQKVCKVCGVSKLLTDFYVNAGNRDGRRPECKTCNLAAQKARRDANPQPGRERARAWQRANRERYLATQRAYIESGRKGTANRKHHLKKKYGLTVDEYDAMLALQGGGCAICGRSPRDDISLHVDHCHDSNAVRGILCFQCNNGLGDFGHNAALLEIAAQYLKAEEEFSRPGS